MNMALEKILAMVPYVTTNAELFELALMIFTVIMLIGFIIAIIHRLKIKTRDKLHKEEIAYCSKAAKKSTWQEVHGIYEDLVKQKIKDCFYLLKKLISLDNSLITVNMLSDIRKLEKELWLSNLFY